MEQPFGTQNRIGASTSQVHSKAMLWVLGFVFVLLGAMPALAEESAQQTREIRPIEKWQNFASKKGKPKYLGDANVVFMRTPKAINGRPITVYVNGEYLTTLLPGGYKGVRVCAGKNSVGMAYVGSISKVDGHKKNPQYWFEMPDQSKEASRKTLYLALVKNAKGHPMLQALQPDSAIEMLKTLKEQTHALSRVGSNCPA